MRRARAFMTSGLSGLTALETTTTSDSLTWAPSWPMAMRPPSVRRRRVTSVSRMSEPETWYPRFSRTSAMPDMPMPPIPTKWIATSRLRNMRSSLLCGAAGACR
jgi:hypothetical protein